MREEKSGDGEARIFAEGNECALSNEVITNEEVPAVRGVTVEEDPPTTRKRKKAEYSRWYREKERLGS